MRLHRLAVSFAVTFIAFTLALPARANIMITINKSAQKMTVTVNGEERYNWPVSTGRSGYDTPSGEFQPFRMERDHFSQEWDDAPMPNSIFFSKIGHAIHGTYEARNLGRAVSHGCVRLSTQNAATLYALVKDEGVFNTRVKLTGETPKGSEDAIARRNGNERDMTRTRDNDRGTARYDDRFTSRNRDYVRNTDDDDDSRDNAPQTRGRDSQFNSIRPYYYQERPSYYQDRPSYPGRGLFFSNGW
jgi:hypothetical protein